MSARVNLIPREIDERNRARRQRVLIGVGALVLVVLLAVAWFWHEQQVEDARNWLAEEEEIVAELQAELDQLEEFAALEERLETAQNVLQATLGDEVSMAGILQDVAAVAPTDVQVTDLGAVLEVEPDVELGATRVPLGTVTISGFTGDHAPGVERLLLELGKVAAFDNIYFTEAVFEQTTGAIRVTVEVDLGAEARTLRYVDGLPEELR